MAVFFINDRPDYSRTVQFQKIFPAQFPTKVFSASSLSGFFILYTAIIFFHHMQRSKHTKNFQNEVNFFKLILFSNFSIAEKVFSVSRVGTMNIWFNDWNFCERIPGIFIQYFTQRLLTTTYYTIYSFDHFSE